MKTKFKLSNRILSLVLAFVMVLGMLPMSSFTAFAADATDTDTAADTTYPYAVVDTVAGTVTIDGTLGGKDTVEESDITALVDAIKGYVDSGITTISVTGSEPALYNFYSVDTPAVSVAIFRLTEDSESSNGSGDPDSPYCGKIDLILQDVTEIVEMEFHNSFALNSITLPKVTKLAAKAFTEILYLRTITFGSVLTEVNETSDISVEAMFHNVGKEVGGCDLFINCGQMNESSVPAPDLTTKTWTFTYANEFKSITLTHTISYQDLGNGTHSAVCTGCGATGTEDHSGGMATCTDLAVCELCGVSYGEVDSDNHTAEPAYSVNEFDSTQHDAYYSCCGATVTEDHIGNPVAVNEFYHKYEGCCGAVDHTGMEPDGICDVCEFAQYDVWVDAIRITSLNKDDVLNDSGSLKYAPDTYTLTVSGNVTVNDSFNDGINNYVIYSKGSIIITGDENSSLTVVSEITDYGVYVDNPDGKLEVTGGMTLNATGSDAGIRASVVEVKNASVINASSITAAAKVVSADTTTYYATLSAALEAGGSVYALTDYSEDFTIPDTVTFYGGEYSFGGAVTNNGTIESGTFNGTVTNNNKINGGTFNGSVTNSADGKIYNNVSADAFTLGDNFSITNNGTIECTYHHWKNGKCRLCASECDHSDSQHESATDKGDGTHSFTCTVCGDTVIENHSGGEATCQKQAVCVLCGTSYGKLNADNHESEEFTYTANADGTTHTKKYKCCDAVADEAEAHDHTNGKCACGVKATPAVTAPTAVSGLEYTGEALTLINAGNTTGGTMQYKVDDGEWSTELPKATNAGIYSVYYKVIGNENYKDVDPVSITVTIVDKTDPTGEIVIKENGWDKFLNWISFGLFCKDYVDVTVTADGTGSGVVKVEYLFSSEALEEKNMPTDGWTEVSENSGTYKFSIQPQYKGAVYVRITDEGGNVIVINSDGIVVYKDSEAVDTEVTYTYKENSNKDIAVEFNGNTVKSIACGEKVLVASTDYSVDYESGKIVLKSTYLDTLSAGNYTFTVSYNPMGVENSGVTDLTTTFSVLVKPIGIDGATVTVNDTFTFDNNAKTPDPVVVLNGKALVKDQDYTVSYADNVNAGTATVTVTGKGNYSGTASGSFEIKRAELTNVSVLQNGKLTYDGGNPLTPAVTENATALNGAKIYFLYCADGNNYGEMPTFTDAGTYTVYYCVYTVDRNFYDVYDTFTVTIDKATVTEPTIASKPYNGSTQTADISDTDLYTVEKNNGGTEKGSYDVVLKLKDSANYKWSTTDNEEVTLQFVISAAQNVWNTKPSISGWTYGETAKTPVGAAKYGTVKVVYSGKANDGTDYNSETAPTKAGSYTATFTVEGTEDYSGLSEQVNFTIAKKAVTVTANDASKTYGDSDPALTYTHTELIGSDALFITVARTSGENANTYTITASQAEGANPNYDITFKTGTFTIRKAILTVTAEDKSAAYGDAVPNYTVKYDGFKNGDDKDDLGGALAFYQTYKQFDDVGEYEIMPHGLTSDNYAFSYHFGKLTVSPKAITVTIQNATSIYGDALAELKATDNGIVNGDTNVYSLATTATGASNVGKYAITGTALDSNYAITFANEADAYEITKREITITAEAKNTIVNTALPTYTYTVSGLFGEDKLVTEPTLTCNADVTVIGEYDITATGADAGGNYSIKYVPAKLSVLTDNAVDAAAGYTEELKDYDPATVTSEDKAALDEILDEINTILDDENITDNGKKALEEVKEKVEDLIKEINDAAEATDTENVGKVENVTPENVTPENKTDLEGAKADLEKALEDHGSNMTEDEKKAVEDEIKRIDDALEVIGNVEAVEELIGKLPENITKNDEDAIKAADDAYNALSDYEKSLVDADAKKALDEAKAALAELNKPADTTSPNTGDNSNLWLWVALLFVSGGAVITLTVVDRKRRTANK